MTIASILRTKGTDVVSVRADVTVQDVVELLHRHRIGAVLVLDGDSVVGVVSERDIIRCLHEKGAGILDATARDIMTAPVVAVAPNDSVDQAMALITERRVRHLPVLHDGRLIGLVSIGDLVKRRIEMAEFEAGALKQYITAS